MKTFKKTVIALLTIIFAGSMMIFTGCDKDINNPISSPNDPIVHDHTILATLGNGSWEGGSWTVPVIINNQVSDLRAMSVKVKISPNAEFNAVAGNALNAGNSLMLMSVALPTHVQCDWAVGTEKGWSGMGEVIKLKFNTQVSTSGFSWKAYDSNGKEFHP